MVFFTHSAWLVALGSSLINSFWQMAILWLLYGAITVMHPRISSHRKHALALGFMCLGSIWFLISLLSGLFWQNELRYGLEALILNPESLLGSGFISGKVWISRLLPYLSAAYLVTLMILFVRYTRYHLHLSKIKSAGLSKAFPQWRLFTQKIALQMGIHKKVSIWLSALVDGPVTIGFLKPIILVPIAMLNQLTTEQAEAILLHELAHIRRNDYLVNLMVTWTGIVFFFNPFCRLLIHQVRKEREHCCDDLVLQFKYNAHSYASALLSLEKSRTAQPKLGMAAIGRNQFLLLERVKRLTGQGMPRKSRQLGILPLFVLTFLFAALLLAKETAKPGHLVAAVRPASMNAEVLPRIFSSAPVVARLKEKKIAKTKKTIAADVVLTDNDMESNVDWVNTSDANEFDEGDQVTAFAPAIQSEKREYSIVMAPPAAGPVEDKTANFPYVPQSSFQFNIEEDTSRPGHFKVRTIDRKIERTQAKKIIVTARDKQRGDEIAYMSEADFQRLKENVFLQTQALENLNRQADPERTIQLQEKLREGRLRLQEQVIRKQLKSIQQQQEAIRIRRHVVYI